jgi:tetratricopeptide (TPR) repeat protein
MSHQPPETGRVAFVTVLREGEGPRAQQSNLDAEALAERLRQEDAGFEVVLVEASDDLAGQIDDHLRQRATPPSVALLYVSADALGEEGEILLQLDPSHPDTADALSDIIEALAEPTLRGEDPETLLLLDLRSQTEDPLQLAEIADLARQVARRSEAAVEVIVAVRPLADGPVSSCSPLTKAILAELDEADPALGVDSAELVSTAFDHARELGRAGALAHASTPTPFTILLGEGATVRAPEVAPIAAEQPDEDEPAEADDRATEVSPEPASELPAVAERAPQPVAQVVPAAAVQVPAAPPSIAPAGSIPPARPSNPPPTLRDAVAEADACEAAGQHEEGLAKLRKALGLVGTSVAPADADAERARLHLRIGEGQLRLGKGREAIASLEKGLTLGPSVAGAERALRTLLGLYLGEGDRRGVASVEERIVARLGEDSAALVPELVTFGRAWMMELNEPLRARERLEHARALAPHNREVAKLLLQLAEKDRRDEDVLGLKRAVAELDPDPKTRAVGLTELARVFAKKGRDDDAFDLYEGALEADPGSLEPLEMLSRALGERQEWAELESAYRRTLERATKMSDEGDEGELKRALEHELNKRLGLLLMQHLEDAEGALRSFDAASAARPEDPGVRRVAAELAHRLGDAPLAERHLASILAADPLDAEAYRLLFDVLVRTEQIERAVEAGTVLLRLGAASDRERVLVNAHAEDEVPPPKGVLSVDDWELLRSPLGPFEGPSAAELVAGVFRAAGAPLVKAFVSLAARAGRLPPLDEALRVEPEASTVSAVRSLLWASKILGVDVPKMYLEDASTEGMTAVLRDEPVTVIGASALRGRTLDELRFLSGYHLACHVPEHRIVRLAPNIDDLAACFLAAVVVAVPDTPVPERIRSLVELIVPGFAKVLQPEQEEALEEAVLAFDAAGGRADLVAFQRAVDVAGMRAGFLLTRKLAASADAAGSILTGPLNEDEREGELYAFAVSDLAQRLIAKLT